MRRNYNRCIALLGGAFDPVHHGHLALARRAAQELPVAMVRLVPNGAPPHRATPQHSWAARVRLCAQAVQHHPRIGVGLEESPEHTRWTIDTVRHYRRRGLRVVLVMGADAFANFHQWRDWLQLLRTVNIAVAQRSGGGTPTAAVRARICAVKNPRLLADGAGRILWWRFRPGDISSTMIRGGCR